MASITGFDIVRQKSQITTGILREIARLIGGKQEHTIEGTFSDNNRVVPGLGLAHEARNLYAQAEALAEGVFTIVVVGTFKNGKSTLLNAMLGDKQLPVGAAPTTGVITMLVYGESDLVQVFEYDKHIPREISRETFFEEYRLKTDDADELKEFRFQNVRYARMETTHPICAKGVRMVDSPGLGEHTSRSELTTNFLKESQAVIVVLDATKLLGIDERQFIVKLGQGRLDHVFFVVNRINLIDEQDQIEDLHRRARSILKPHFSNNGIVDEQRFAERVFWVDARGALRGRQKSPPDLAQIDASNIRLFETQLEHFLTADQMFLAATRSALHVVVDSIQAAQSFIVSEKHVLHQPVEELIKKRDLAHQQLDELERRCVDIEEIINRTGEKVQLQLEIHLQNFVDQMVHDWEEDMPKLIESINEINFKDIAVAGLMPKVREKIGTVFKSAIEQYLTSKFDEWSVSASELTQTEVEKLREQLKTRIAEFTVKLQQARGTFTSDEMQISREQQDIAVKITTGIFVGGTGLSGVIFGVLRRLTALMLILSISTLTVFGWAVLIVLILAEIGIIVGKPDDFKRQVLERIGKRVHDSLRDDIRTQNFSQANLRNMAGLLRQLKERPQPLDIFVYQALGAENRKIVDNFVSIERIEDETVAPRIAEDLNQLISGDLIYTPERFEGRTLADETQRLLENHITGDDLRLLNRYLLVDAYPDLISPKIKDTINRVLRTQFIKVAQDITSGLYDQIDQMRGQMDRTIAELQSKTFSIEQETQRLDQIDARLVELVEHISQQLYDRPLTLDELQHQLNR